MNKITINLNSRTCTLWSTFWNSIGEPLGEHLNRLLEDNTVTTLSIVTVEVFIP